MCRLTAEELRPGSGSVLFAFAGAGGDTTELAPLADGLTGERRVVALALAGDPRADTLETMAVESVCLIRAEQPHGPYQLLGYSFGGLVALESARLLSEAGETVTFVGLVDSFFDQQHWPTRLFVRATARRAAVHVRGLVRQPPARAVHELAVRSARLVSRLRTRGRLTAAGPTSGFATVQEANLAVMAQWRPRVFDHPVTLLAATASDFGCDLAELWRPWLPQLDVRRVWGNHLDLTQTAPGSARLSRAVNQALQSPPPRLTVLVATTFRWPGAARLAVDLHEVGCAVEGVAPRGSPVHAVSAVRRSHPLGLADPIRSLRRAIEASDPDVVVPFDDRTRQALTRLHAASDPTTASGAHLRACLERSLGSPDTFGSVYSRAALMAIARDAGITCPPTAGVYSADDIAVWMRDHPGPAVLKTDGSWGGRGVAILHNEAEGRRAWREMYRLPPLTRALKRLVVERDPWALRARMAGIRPTLSIQAFVPGRPANAAVACYRGTPLGAVQAEVVESDGPTGPSTVLRVIEHPDMAYAVKSIVSNLELSGLCGLDFILDDDGRAQLLELNPRATPTSHLIGADGTDLLTALRRAYGYDRPPVRTASYPDGLVALFPQQLHHDPSSPNLRLAHHDVPTHAPDLVASVMAGLRGRRGTVTPPQISTQQLESHKS